MLLLCWLWTPTTRCSWLGSSPKLGVSTFSNLLLPAFEFDKLNEQQREDLLRKALCLLEGKEFCEILIPCIGETVDRFTPIMQKGSKDWLWQKLSSLKHDKEDLTSM